MQEKNKWHELQMVIQ